LYSPRQLIESTAGPEDWLGHAAFLDRAREELERGRETSSRVCLAGYLVQRLIDRLDRLPGTEEDRESFQWQLQGVRRYLDELPDDLPDSEHLRGLVRALNHPPSNRPATLRMSLSAFAYYLEHEGRYEEALDLVSQAARTFGASVPLEESPRLALEIARLNRRLARWNRANDAYSAAEQAARVLGDERSVLLSRLGRANVMRGQGNLPAARLAVDGVIADATPLDLPEVLGRAYADLGAILAVQGQQLDSLVAQYRAFEYAPDYVTRCRALGDVAVSLRALGVNDVARQAFEIVLDSRASFNVKANAAVELMELEAAEGDRIAFERRRQAARSFEAKMPPSMAVDFRYKQGLGLAHFGQQTQARRELREAMALAERHQLNEWYFRIERTLERLDEAPTVAAPTPTARVELLETPALAEVAAGLRRYAEQAGTT